MVYQNYLDCHYNIDTMKKFYQFIDFTNFKLLTQDRIIELDQKAAKIKGEMAKYRNRMSVMGIVANRLMASSQSLGLKNGDEIAYFYIKVVDDNLLYLELANIATDKEELKDLCIRKFGVYDNVIIHLEKYLVNRLDSLQIEKDAEMSI